MAVIFDMDGVLVDTEPMYVEVTWRVLKQHGATEERAGLYRYVGISAPKMWAELKSMHALSPSVAELVAEERHAQHTAINNVGSLKPMPGIPELLCQLRDGGVKIALASSSSGTLITSVLFSIGLTDFFPIVVSGEDVENGKPAPDIFLKAAALLDCSPASCVVVEDSPHGLAGACAAGMIGIGYRNAGSGNQCLEGADVAIDAFGSSERDCILDMAKLAQYGARSDALGRATQLRSYASNGVVF